MALYVLLSDADTDPFKFPLSSNNLSNVDQLLGYSLRSLASGRVVVSWYNIIVGIDKNYLLLRPACILPYSIPPDLTESYTSLIPSLPDLFQCMRALKKIGEAGDEARVIPLH